MALLETNAVRKPQDTKVALISRQLNDSQGWGLGLARTLLGGAGGRDCVCLTSLLWHRVPLSLPGDLRECSGLSLNIQHYPPHSDEGEKVN